MSRTIIVPDTSVLLKWVLESEEEEDRNRALELRESWLADKCAIVLPALWFFEVGNILGMKEPDLAEQLIGVLVRYAFEEEPAANIYAKTFELMKRFKVTFYDAVYHATAIRHGGIMVTADDTYFRKTSRVGHIEILANWSSVR
jgi:predicted nucleic acid-binding protein